MIPASKQTVIHIASSNMAETALCGLRLQEGDRLLAAFMKKDAYLRHWWRMTVTATYPNFCQTCTIKAEP